MIRKIPEHGSPQDRGSVDRYYGRPFHPHWYPQGTYHGEEVPVEEMSEEEIAAYEYGYENELSRKLW